MTNQSRLRRLHSRPSSYLSYLHKSHPLMAVDRFVAVVCGRPDRELISVAKCGKVRQLFNNVLGGLKTNAAD